MSTTFSKKSFDYFDRAKRNSKNKEWFLKHQPDFKENVFEPFAHLTERLNEEFSKELPQIPFLPRKISRPLRRNPDEKGGIIRSSAYTYFSEKPTSQFEWNPGIYVSIGTKSDDNVLGLGLYMVSSRQMSLLRQALVDDFDEIDRILSSKKLKARWGRLSGELYKRFPKGFDESSEAAKYLRHKQFFLSQELTPKRVMQKNFAETLVADVECALPFLIWIRKTVGVYRG